MASLRFAFRFWPPHNHTGKFLRKWVQDEPKRVSELLVWFYKSHKMPIPHIKQQIPVKQHRSYLNTIHNAGTHYRLTNVTENYNNILFSNLCDNFLYDLSSKLNKERDPSWCSVRWYMPLLIEIGSLCRSRQTLFSRLNNLSLDLTYLAGPAQLCIALHFACCCFLNTPRIKQFR